MLKKYIPSEKKCFSVMSRQQSRDFDRWAINELKIPSVVLMENAGINCAQLILDRLVSDKLSEVCIFCGTGNNGGDGFVIARHLFNAGIKPLVVICQNRNKIKGDARINLEIIEKMQLSIVEMDMERQVIKNQVEKHAAESNIIVDAIFGTGFSGELSSEYIRLVTCINSLGRTVLSVDIPSGLDCDTGLPLPVSIKADITITFGGLKKGFVTCPELQQATGEIFVASIGIEPPGQLRASDSD